MDAHDAFAAEITALHAACRTRLESGLPTRLRRADYHEALCLADAAAQLAADAALDAGVVAACEALQGRCEAVLRGWYSVIDQRERDLYKRAAAAARPPGTGPQTKASCWSKLVAVVGLQTPANLAPAERRSVIKSLRARL